MKISKIEIGEENQFKNLVIDLTYPAGHPKAGKPLDKVCIIGQSGTGKTTLLNTIQAAFQNMFAPPAKERLEIPGLANTFFYINLNNILIKTRSNIFPDFWVNNLYVPDLNEIHRISIFVRSVLLENRGPMLIYNQTRSDFDIPELSEYSNKSVNPNTYYIFDKVELTTNKKFYNINPDEITHVWHALYKEIMQHHEKEIKMNEKITNIVIEKDFDPEKLQAARKELNELKTKNPLLRLAEQCLDPLLTHFNLKVKTDLDFQTKDDIGSIKITDRQNRIIPNALLSTGTKQILLGALPLFVLQPKEAVIMYDEPERSLYPNMQQIIVDYYTSMAEDSQFFFATHSPIIAASFEPWEIVELKFNEDGYVEQELYYDTTKERHVDNYKIIPKYLTYDLMLKKVFDIKEPYNQERINKMTEFLSIKGRMDYLKKEGMSNTQEYLSIFEEYMKAGKELSWDLTKA